MNYSLVYLVVLFGFSATTVGQDTLKQIKPTIQGQPGRTAASMPQLTMNRVKELNATPKINGNYTIDRYAVQLKKRGNKSVIKAVGSKVAVTEVLVSGSAIDSITFQISETEIMSIEDYLFRIFGELPAEIPSDLPENIFVHKTNNLSCYAIGQLADGTLLIPREGVLLYLRRS